jgi:hypothetical protein
MQYIVTKQISVEADEPEDAAMKSKTEGKVMSLSVNPRPTPPGQQAVGPSAQEKLAERKQEKK